MVVVVVVVVLFWVLTLVGALPFVFPSGSPGVASPSESGQVRSASKTDRTPARQN